TGWSTTDAEEIERRRWRGKTEIQQIRKLEPNAGPFANYQVPSNWGGAYTVEIRSLDDLENSCTCRDYETSRLGTCKHIEGVLYRLRKSNGRAFKSGDSARSPRIEIFLSHDDRPELKIGIPERLLNGGLANQACEAFDSLRETRREAPLRELQCIANENPGTVRLSALIESWRRERAEEARKTERRKNFLENVNSGKQTFDILRFPLFPYQRDGMLHLAFGQRALLADDMGLGKTVQALAACQLLAKVEDVKSALVVCPASLKAEWEEQILAATELSHRIVFGNRPKRLLHYAGEEFFKITNYEQILIDIDDINGTVKPEIVILDEAQRIKNWRTKTASAIKRIRSRYAFVLTGTPLENRIDEIYSIIQFLDPKLLGPLFKFNREYYRLDDRGRPEGYKNLDKLGERVRSVMLRRRKSDVEKDLPNRTVNNFFVPMTAEQEKRYADYEHWVQIYLKKARDRPLTEEEFKRMQMGLACMRMICDTPFILDTRVKDSPKLEELESLLEDLLEDKENKIIIFSEWVRMLELIKERLDDLGFDYAWHTGQVPQTRRRLEVNRFKQDPNCRIFLSTESGGAGLNLQVANAVINVDLPWNPAKLEQRIARAWRKHQKRAVTVVNLVAENTIEHRMLNLLDHKKAVADAVLDDDSDIAIMDMPSGRTSFIEKLEQIIGEPAEIELAPDPVETAVEYFKEKFGCELVALELRDAGKGNRKILAVVQSLDKAKGEKLAAEVNDPPVECIDVASYETMLRLEESGLLEFSAARLEYLFRREDEDPQVAAAARIRESAESMLEEAERLRKMAELLVGGGFEKEADAQSRNIAANAVQALAAMFDHEDFESQVEEKDIHRICDRLADQGLISRELQFKALWLTADASDSGTDGKSKGRLPEAIQLLELARNKIRE
ncbi:MAG: DEAD/DEAH box helicase, partial [Albidovulum sp.]|nr:DEAD/DEAH box helicase [Albidovulum sp.]